MTREFKAALVTVKERKQDSPESCEKSRRRGAWRVLGDDSDHMRLDTREEDNMSHHSDDGMLIAGTYSPGTGSCVTVPVHSRSTNESWNENDFLFLENAHNCT